jgi:hypothetical protein
VTSVAFVDYPYICAHRIHCFYVARWHHGVKRDGVIQRWPGKTGQRVKWIFCLTAAMVAA